MNPVVRQMAKYTRDLLGLTVDDILIGRDNEEIDNFDAPTIVIDCDVPSKKVARSKKYDPIAEVQYISVLRSYDCILSFYGNDAVERAQDFELMVSSQTGFELKKTHSLSILGFRDLTDVGNLTGSEYSGRADLTVTVWYNKTISINTKRIDTAQVSIHTENNEPIDILSD